MSLGEARRQILSWTMKESKGGRQKKSSLRSGMRFELDGDVTF